ncbi:peptide-methionine (R)-S-oxide reductase MsrB [Flavobacteriaceae bacterium M23B6Z8]
MKENKKYAVEKSEAAWKAQLSPEEYRILREKGTEYPHTGEYNLHFEKGMYNCRACNAPLFKSDQKFESGCGWPSFDDALEGAIEYHKDHSFGMVRTEIVCANCGGHLGHIFDDGPTPTGMRYCVNSASIDFDDQK